MKRKVRRGKQINTKDEDDDVVDPLSLPNLDDWICPNCTWKNTPFIRKCKQCQTVRDLSAEKNDSDSEEDKRISPPVSRRNQMKNKSQKQVMNTQKNQKKLQRKRDRQLQRKDLSAQEIASNGLAAFPIEILLFVFGWVDLKTLLCLKQTSKYFRSVASDESLWHDSLINNFLFDPKTNLSTINSLLQKRYTNPKNFKAIQNWQELCKDIGVFHTSETISLTSQCNQLTHPEDQEQIQSKIPTYVTNKNLSELKEFSLTGWIYLPGFTKSEDINDKLQRHERTIFLIKKQDLNEELIQMFIYLRPEDNSIEFVFPEFFLKKSYKQTSDRDWHPFSYSLIELKMFKWNNITITCSSFETKKFNIYFNGKDVTDTSYGNSDITFRKMRYCFNGKDINNDSYKKADCVLSGWKWYNKCLKERDILLVSSKSLCPKGFPSATQIDTLKEMHSIIGKSLKHVGKQCSCCNGEIYGPWYKCNGCSWSLCSSCLNKKLAEPSFDLQKLNRHVRNHTHGLWTIFHRKDQTKRTNAVPVFPWEIAKHKERKASKDKNQKKKK